MSLVSSRQTGAVCRLTGLGYREIGGKYLSASFAQGDDDDEMGGFRVRFSGCAFSGYPVVFCVDADFFAVFLVNQFVTPQY